LLYFKLHISVPFSCPTVVTWRYPQINVMIFVNWIKPKGATRGKKNARVLPYNEKIFFFAM